MLQTQTIRDLVGVRTHPTVVRLDHLEAGDAGWITTTYHITPAVDAHLQALRHALAQPAGTGMFLIGQYGSGKSHFLAYVVQNLAAGRFQPDGPEVVALSLLNYRSETALEDIVSAALGLEERRRGRRTGRAGGGGGGGGGGGDPGDRRIAWSRLAERHPRGVLLVIDELSEFLRSKPGRSRFTEDVRFLQFMGEWSQGHRFWVLASMQEQIEHTGELEHGLYRKIKDRFPVRFMLTPAHVRDLVRDGILVRHPGHEEAGRQIASEVRRALPQAALDLDALAALYPIHPATIEILEEVRDCFSQARGIVDFTVTQLAGDPARGVEPFLDRPWSDLLTPDHIVDHFRDLFEVQFEHLPLAQQLFPWYEKHLPELFERQPLRELAARLLKLLVLVHLSPARDRLTPEEATAWLLYRASKIEPERNVAVIRKVLDRLAGAGRFVEQRGRGYRLDLEEDDAEAFERRLEAETADCELQGEAVFEQLALLLDGRDFNPFALPRDEVQHRTCRWHFHERRYGAVLGNADPPASRTPLLVIRLFFGEPAAAAAGALTVVPERLRAERRHFELTALCRLRARRWKETTARKLAARIEEKVAAFENEVRNAYAAGMLLDESGRADAGAVLGGGRQRLATFDGFVGSLAELLFKRRYPAFERFAPSHGPLPAEAYRRFTAFALEHDLGSEQAGDDYVKLIREAYLVPMGLLERAGRGYRVPRSIERHDLYRLLRPRLDDKPVPKSVHEHLAAPVFGLVPDQIHLLLIFLLLLGEIDIVKDGKSYRELYPLLPDTLKYDRIEAGRALGSEQLRRLEALCEGLGIRVPKQWNVLAQRRAVQRLREHGRGFAASIQPVLFRLEEEGQGRKLADRLRGLLQHWRALDAGGGDELRGCEQFFYEIGPVQRFLGQLREVRDLPARLDHLITETRRYRHLFRDLPRRPAAELGEEHAEELGEEPAAAGGQPADATLTISVELPGEPPDLDAIEQLESWLSAARGAYEQYQREYRRRHTDWWREIERRPLWRWQPPPVAASRHLALDAALRELRDVRQAAERRRCRGPIDLDFRPLCRCGFDGRSGPVATELERLAAAREAIESSLRLFFGQESVRERVQVLVDEGLEGGAATLAYLEGAQPYPHITAIERLDRHLAGVEVVKTVRGAELLACLEGRTWERREALAAIADYLDAAASEEQRLRIDTGTAGAGGAGAGGGARDHDEVTAWCLRQSLRHGVRLPRGLARDALGAAGQSLQPDEVGAAALRRLDALGLDDPTIDRIVGWMADGVLEVPAAPPAGPPGQVREAGGRAAEPALLTAVRELTRPSAPASAGELAALAATLYAVTARLRAVAGERWLARLERLAKTRLAPPLPDLMCALDAVKDAQWLVIDCLGLPLVPQLLPELTELFDPWRLDEVCFAAVGPETTTDACYRELVAAGFVRALKKINVIDALIHERSIGRTDSFDDLARLAAAELRIACGQVARELDAALPLAVFADHGFRVTPDGRAFGHGGASTLERVVPLLRFVPA